MKRIKNQQLNEKRPPFMNYFLMFLAAIGITLVIANIQYYTGETIILGEYIAFNWGTLLLVFCIAFLFPVLYAKMRGDRNKEKK